VKTALTQRKFDPSIEVPWTGFDLINTFNAWKKTEDAGRVFTVGIDGTIDVVVTGLAWRAEVCQQVFEEAAVDLGAGLKGWSDSRCGKRKGKRVGFPRFKKKAGALPSFRLRNRHRKDRTVAIRVGEKNRPRSITLPGIGQIGVHDDTRRLRRMLAKGRATILFATISHHAGRWSVSVNVEAADLHQARQHPARHPSDDGGWVGIDRGLSAFLVASTSDGQQVARIDDPPKALTAGMAKQKRLAKRCPARRKDHTTVVTPPPNWPVITITSPMCAAISCISHGRAGQDPRPARHRRSEHRGDADQPSPGARDLRCWVGRIRPPAALQTGLARWSSGHR
jgi:putative transposase